MPRPQPTSREPTRVGLIEDDLLYRDYLLNVLEGSGRYETIALAASVEEAMGWSALSRMQAVLCDIRLPGQAGPAIVAHLAQEHPALRTIMLTAHDDADSILESFRAGACGYIVKGATSGEILEALDDALEGGAPMSPSIARQVLGLLRKPPSPVPPASGAGANSPAPALGDLTPRENDVIQLVVDGRADKEVAALLGISRSAVKNHLSNIYAKWRVRSRTEAAVRFVQARQS